MKVITIPKSKPLHQLTKREYKRTIKAQLTWGEYAKRYPQPEWCNYPNAVSPLGCWSLIAGYVRHRGYCKGCECLKI